MNETSLQDIIDFAIWKEQKSVDFYKALLKKVDSEEVSREVIKIIAMEERHRDWLKDNALSLFSERKSSHTTGTGTSTVESADDIHPVETLTWVDIIDIAIRSETAAEQLYRTLASTVTDLTANEVLKNLADEEHNHKVYFEKLRAS